MAFNSRNLGYVEEGRLSLKNLAILYMQYVVYSNAEVVVLNIEGFCVIISKAEKYMENFVCTATVIYNRAGKNEKKTYYIKTIVQLNKWLKCIREHSRQAYISGFTDDVPKITTALISEPLYVMAKLDNIKE